MKFINDKYVIAQFDTRDAAQEYLDELIAKLEDKK